jgi:Fe-S oxidoreductase
MYASPLIFATLLILASFVFVFSCYRRLCLISLGSQEDRFSEPQRRILATLRYAFGQLRVIARPYGFIHLALFWSFLVLLIANSEFILQGLFPSISLALLPAPIHHGLLLLIDLVSLLTLIAVTVAALRRLLFPPDYLGTKYASARSPQAFFILACIAILMFASLTMNGVVIAAGGDAALASWQPVAAQIAALFSGSSHLAELHGIAWWLHAFVLLVFLCFLPQSKHMHILTAIPNCYFSSLERPNSQSREAFSVDNPCGAGQVDLLSWKDLFDSFTCTECGRCQSVCPAHLTGKPLNPRCVVHDIKENLVANGPALLRGEGAAQSLIGTEGEGSVAPDALWSCTTCGACLAACPVLIEQMPKIIKLRRHLVQEKAQFPEELLNLFENMEQRSNPWGIAPSERTKWSGQLGDRTFKPGETEYLFFVGCAGAFDNRNKHVTVALATIMDAAGVSWGMLGKEEQCCGDSVRRLGNEFVFERMAKANVSLLKEKKVTKIVTQCPHCFNTLKNDYKQYGLEIEVLHHSQLIDQLAKTGRLKLPQQSGQGKVIFHDSCYLGRHNDTYEAPRAVLQAATGRLPGEFGRNRENGFCCGAGGGRMWLEEQSGFRINLERVKEAMAQQPDTLCVSCPYCMTMMEDGLKDLGLGDKVRVKDIAEVTAEALR